MSLQNRTRSACDRCHTQKLRCPKQAGSTTCARCLKAGARCVYSPPGTNFTPVDDINVACGDMIMNGNGLGVEQTSSFADGLGWAPHEGIDFNSFMPHGAAGFNVDGQGHGQTHGYATNSSSTLRDYSDPILAETSSSGNEWEHGDPSSVCVQKLTSLLKDADRVWSTLAARTALHMPRTKLDETFLTRLSEKLSTQSTLESFFGLTQQLIDMFPAAVGATMAAKSETQHSCDLTDCTHQLELMPDLQQVEDQILGQGVFSGPDAALSNLLVSCHTRILDVLDRILLLVTSCTRFTLAERREPDFEVSELRVGAFVPPRTAAVLMQVALLKHLMAGLADGLASFAKAISS